MGQRHAPAAPDSRERPGTHSTGGWVGLRAGLDWCGKSRPTGIRYPDRPARRQSKGFYILHLIMTRIRGVKPGKRRSITGSGTGSYHLRKACGQPSLLMQLIPGTISPTVKRPGREVDRTSQSVTRLRMRAVVHPLPPRLLDDVIKSTGTN